MTQNRPIIDGEEIIMDREHILSEIRRVNRLWKDSDSPSLVEKLNGAKFFAAYLLYKPFENTFEDCEAEVEKACGE